MYTGVVAARGDRLQFDQLIAVLRETMEQFPDRRTGQNTHDSMSDVAFSAFSVFFMQSPLFLDFQRQMGRSKGRHNAGSLFGVTEVPSDNHIRSLLDVVPPESLYSVFDEITEQLIGNGITGCVESHHKLGELEQLSLSEWIGKERRTIVYQWIDDVPIRSSEDALLVGWV